jgi:hypothetical protein
LFNVPTVLVTDVGVDASGVLGGKVIELDERLANTATFSQRVKCLDDFLLKRLMACKPLDEIHRALNQLIMSCSPIRIADIAAHAGVTIRCLEWLGRIDEIAGGANEHILRRHDSKCPLRTGCVGSLRYGGVHQALDFRPLAAWIKDRTLAAGIQLQQSRLFSGEMGLPG